MFKGIGSAQAREALGADATEFPRAYLADPKIVATDEMKPVTMLPMGVSRKVR